MPSSSTGSLLIAAGLSVSSGLDAPTGEMGVPDIVSVLRVYASMLGCLPRNVGWVRAIKTTDEEGL